MSGWQIEGSYYETCNCDAICPCRRQGDARGGDSTYDDCEFLLSWKILSGRAGDVDLAGLLTAIAGRYSDDEDGKPWTVKLYIDRAGGEAQFEALSDIFLGRRGGNISFVQNIAHIVGVERAEIAVEHGAGQETIRVGEAASASVTSYVDHDFPVSCGISGHDNPGRESVCDSTVKDGPFDWTYEGRCGFSSRFAYEGA